MLYSNLISVGQWYLSKRGTDTPDCGTSYESSCLTLDYLLNRSFGQTHSATLAIITDKNMIFNNSLVVSLICILDTIIKQTKYISFASNLEDLEN